VLSYLVLGPDDFLPHLSDAEEDKEEEAGLDSSSISTALSSTADSHSGPDTNDPYAVSSNNASDTLVSHLLAPSTCSQVDGV
jgi:hypothetical protein